MQAVAELKRLSGRTVTVTSGASQASLNRHQAVELLQVATGTALGHPSGKMPMSLSPFHVAFAFSMLSFEFCS